MDNQPRHEMVLETTHPSGAEEWSCPICGRRMTITWQPWKKIILEPGDVYATHDGSKGNLKMRLLDINKENQGGSSSNIVQSAEDPHLAPWVRWLDKMDWDDFWNDDI